MTAAVLFDYGGVIGEVVKPPDGPGELAAAIAAVLGRAGAPMPVDDIATDLDLGMRAYEGWKRAQSRSSDPREIGHREFWEFTACDWPEQARAALLAAATPLCRLLELTVIHRPARPDAAAVLTALRSAGVATAIVCNCLSGNAAREQLRRDGLTDLLDVQIYSDELGFRKPGPTIVHAALSALGAEPQECWFVGDRIDRDILAARRAGIGRTALFRTPSGPGAAIRGAEPDQTIERLSELIGLLGLPALSGSSDVPPARSGAR